MEKCISLLSPVEKYQLQLIRSEKMKENKEKKALKNKRIKQRKMSKKKRRVRRELFRMELFLDGIVIKKKNFYVRYVGETFEEYCQNNPEYGIRTAAIKDKLYRCTLTYYSEEGDKYYKIKDESGGFQLYKQAKTPEDSEIQNVERIVL